MSRCPTFPGCAEKRPYHALKENEKDEGQEKRRLATLARAGHRHQTRKAPSQLKLNSEEGVRAAFYVSWDAASFSSLREYARQIDLLFPDMAAGADVRTVICKASIRKPTRCLT